MLLEEESVFGETASRRRERLLDLLIIVVTMVPFIAFIGFTVACDHLGQTKQ